MFCALVYLLSVIFSAKNHLYLHYYILLLSVIVSVKVLLFPDIAIAIITIYLFFSLAYGDILILMPFL